MRRKHPQRSIARRAALAVSALLLAATAACTALEASLEGGHDAQDAQQGGDGAIGQLARDSQSGG